MPSTGVDRVVFGVLLRLAHSQGQHSSCQVSHEISTYDEVFDVDSQR